MAEFPFELRVLGVLALFAASLWIPYIIGVNTSDPGSAADLDSQDFSRPADPSLQRPWVHRAYRAHLNLLEQAVPFAILVLLVDRADGFNALTWWTSLAFLTLRVAHTIGFITGAAGLPLRPILFTAGWVCCVIMGWAFFTA